MLVVREEDSDGERGEAELLPSASFQATYEDSALYERIERAGRPIGVVNQIMDGIFLVDLVLQFFVSHRGPDGILIAP